MTKINWHIEKKAVKDLKTWSKNPRKITREAFEKLKQRITERGFHDVIKVDTDLTILSGNQRKLALSELNIAEVTVLIPDRTLTEDERNMVALESNTNDGTWELNLLKDFNLETLKSAGFDNITLAKIFDTGAKLLKDDWDNEKELRKIKETNIKPGDIFALGRHRLICGSALDKTVVQKLMGDVKADLVDDDMPFNIGLSYSKGVGNKADRYGGTTNDSKSEEEYKQFVGTIVKNALAVTKKDAHLIFWCDERYVFLLQMLYRELGVNSKRLLVWIKDNSSPVPTSAFNKVTEFAVYGSIGSPYLSKTEMNLNEIQNHSMTTGNNLQQEIMDHLNIMLTKRLPSNQYQHPTEKSPLLHHKAIRRCTRVGDVVLDLTAGSGSILIACEQLNRTSYLCELEPIFCQLIINHYEKLTGQKVTLITNIHEEK
jgi:DNA modification methylase